MLSSLCRRNVGKAWSSSFTRSITIQPQVVRFYSADPAVTSPTSSVEDAAPEKGYDEVSTTRGNGKLPIDYADISRAEIAIRGGVKRTVCEKSHFISDLVGASVYFKYEFRQFTGSFKERGARNAILHLMREKGSQLRGVIAASAGNHALALAYHGKELGVPVTVVMPTVAPMAKVDKCRVSSFCLERIVHHKLCRDNGSLDGRAGMMLDCTPFTENAPLIYVSVVDNYDRNLALASLLKVPISVKPKNLLKLLLPVKVYRTLMAMTILLSSLVLGPWAWKSLTMFPMRKWLLFL